MEIELSDYSPDINVLKLRVLNNNHNKYNSLQSEFDQEINILREKYKRLLDTQDELRIKIIEGSEKVVKEDLNEIEDIEKVYVDLEKKEEELGIPLYWMNVLKNCNRFRERINKKDNKILTFLKRIYVTEKNRRCFTINFVFDKNRYFLHEELSKTYVILDNEIYISSTYIQWRRKNLAPIYESFILKERRNRKVNNVKYFMI